MPYRAFTQQVRKIGLEKPHDGFDSPFFGKMTSKAQAFRSPMMVMALQNRVLLSPEKVLVAVV